MASYRLDLVAWSCVACGLLASPARAQVDEAPPSEPEATAVAAQAQATPPEPAVATVDLEAVLRGDGRGLTADRAARRAVRTAPSIDRARQAALEAQAGAASAIYGFIPQLTIGARYARLTPIQNGQVLPPEAFDAIEHVMDDASRQLWSVLAERPFPVVLDQASFVATVAVPVSDYFLTVSPRWQAADGIVEAQSEHTRATAQDVALSAREAFYQYARARGAAAVAQIALDQSIVREREIEARLAVGQVGPAEVMQGRSLTAQARVAVARAQGGVEIAGEALRTLLHEDGEGPLAVSEDVLRELPADIGSRRALLRRALDERPEVRALRHVIAARGHLADAGEGERFPSLVVFANADYSYPNGRVFPQTPEFRFSANAGAGLEWSPHDMLYGGRAADEARAQQEQTRADLRALEDAIRTQVIQAHVEYGTAREALAAARVGVDAAGEVYRVRMAQFRTGNALIGDLVDASVEQARAQLQLVNAAIDGRLALARLRRAVGSDVVETP